MPSDIALVRAIDSRWDDGSGAGGFNHLFQRIAVISLVGYGSAGRNSFDHRGPFV